MANLVVGAGYGLLLSAIALLTGRAITLRTGVLWGAGAWVAVHLMPALGLPPELPGMPVADLTARQVWWACTILASGTGVYLLAFRPQAWARALGVALLAAPQVAGAPQPESLDSALPALSGSRICDCGAGDDAVLLAGARARHGCADGPGGGLRRGSPEVALMPREGQDIVSSSAGRVPASPPSRSAWWRRAARSASISPRAVPGTPRCGSASLAHQARRGAGWRTVEEPLDLAGGAAGHTRAKAAWCSSTA